MQPVAETIGILSAQLCKALSKSFAAPGCTSPDLAHAVQMCFPGATFLRWAAGKFTSLLCIASLPQLGCRAGRLVQAIAPQCQMQRPLHGMHSAGHAVLADINQILKILLNMTPQVCPPALQHQRVLHHPSQRQWGAHGVHQQLC